LGIEHNNGYYYVNIDGNWNEAKVISNDQLQSSSKYGVHVWKFLSEDVVEEKNRGSRFIFARNYQN
jgi:hypothetical protein